MFDLQKLHGLAVGDDVAFEAPALPEDVGEKIRAAGDRDAVVVVVGAHDAERAGVLDRRLERHEKHHLDFARRHLWIGPRAAVAAALRHAVHRKVLRRRDDMRRLDRAHLNPSERGGQVRILAVGLDRASPARIARQVENRRVDVGVAERARFAAGDGPDLLDQIAIPGAGDAQLRRKARRAIVIQSADPLVGEIHRDAEPRLLDEPALDGVDRAGVDGERIGERALLPFHGPAVAVYAVQVLIDVADAVLPDGVFPGRRRQFVRKHARVPVQRRELAALFLERHPREQIVDAPVHRHARIFVRILLPVLVEVDPAVLVDRRAGGLQQQRGDDERQDSHVAPRLVTR